jgi:hypothetical protein
METLYEVYNLYVKFSRASSRVKWLKVDKTDVSRTISVLVVRETEGDFSFPDDEHGDGPRNVGFIYF